MWMFSIVTGYAEHQDPWTKGRCIAGVERTRDLPGFIGSQALRQELHHLQSKLLR
jgi:hypothetical protein